MKRAIIIIMVLCVPFNITKAQNGNHKTKTIELDFKTKEFIMPECPIREGDYYKIIIENINMNLFKVSLTSRDTTIGKPLETPAFGNFNIDALSGLLAGVSPLSTSITQMNNAVLKADSFTTSTRPEPKVDLIKGRMVNEKKSLNDCKSKTENIARTIDSIKLEVYKTRLNSLKLDNMQGTFNSIEVLTRIEKIRKNISELQDFTQKSKISFEEFSAEKRSLILKNEELRTNDTAIKESYQKSLSTLTDVFVSVSSDKVWELLSGILSIENNAGNTYTSLPLQFLGEQAKVKILIAPRDEKYNLQTYKTEIVFPITKFYKVVGLSYYISSLHDSAYTTVETLNSDLDTIFKIEKENSVNFELGLTVLMRYGIKFNDENNFGGHLSIGAGISLSNKIKPRFFGGAGISIGIKHMLALDMGAVFGYVDRLSNNISLTADYQIKPETVTVSKPRSGIFGSIGYIYQF